VQETESGSASSVDVWTKKTAMEQFHGIKGKSNLKILGDNSTQKSQLTMQPKNNGVQINPKNTGSNSTQKNHGCRFNQCKNNGYRFDPKIIGCHLHTQNILGDM